MSTITMKDLLESGVHFGHQTRRWNPKMKPYIFGERNGIYIVDLQKTQRMAAIACRFVSEVVAGGGEVLFVGTKRQAQDAITKEAVRCGVHYVNYRWLGGTLTNFKTIRNSVDKLIELEERDEKGELSMLPLKEAMSLRREKDKLNRVHCGIRDMKRAPDVMFVIDINREDIAIKEARVLGIPVVALVDTNCNPDGIDYIIPGNDDAIRSIQLFSAAIADAVLKGRELSESRKIEMEKVVADEVGDDGSEEVNTDVGDEQE